ncbi:hypothetical protein LGM71_29810 [Burkholderia sp. AU33545]|uniref:hypothetical protein n=1 Tax=Burkholderia sp. AU33545 TaxID=2879631 RepID=UPI001CF39AAB|nr:hypothetical protein [Burkholderia sp. AU33545]MCA8205240.1 hypothetical protein [Burkholderia sp. AU33545]
MDDYAYLVAESNAAWLSGRGDGRFERYEQFYRTQCGAGADGFDLERTNEEYGEWVHRQPPRLLALLAKPAIGKVFVAIFCVYMAAQFVPMVAGQAPRASGVLLGATFVGLRIFHWRHRKRR